MEQETALIITADSQAANDAGEDVLSLGLGYEVADNQREASRLIQANHYACIVLDPEIPASPRCRRPRVEAAEDLLDAVKQVADPWPALVVAVSDDLSSRMAAADIAELGADLREKGVVRFIRKPFPTSGRTLYKVLKKALRRGPSQEQRTAPKRQGPQEPLPFDGGVMAFYPNHVELCGETIVERSQRGHAWKILGLLRGQNERGNHTRYSGNRLAEAVSKRIGQNAVAQCIADLRNHISEIMRERLGLLCGKFDVVDNRGKGYHLRNWIRVEVHDASQGEAQASDVTGDICGDKGRVTGDITRDTDRVTGDKRPAKPDVPGVPTNVPANARQKWILGEVAQDRKLRRQDVEKRFGVGPRTVKRDLKGLADQGLIEFVLKGKSGYYRLKER